METKETFTSVPFVQYLRPNRKRELTSIERPSEIVELAGRFIAAGGWFESEALPGHHGTDPRGYASLTACLSIDGESQDIEMVVVPNGPGVEGAVDKLVVKATKRLAFYQEKGAKIDPDGGPYPNYREDIGRATP